MSDDVTEHEFPEEPVIGDGILTLPPSEGKKKMPVDLPESVAVNLLAEATNNMQNNNRQGRDTFTLASGALQAGIAKTLNELGPVESRSVSGVMATPVASPAVQAPGA
ncbi:MAG: hypothetical protein CMK32_08135 [Porticoccaceae bacterium]|nr:hypothetical protein [Porticoccaceae bacterium]